jgi:hypothetical protein
MPYEYQKDVTAVSDARIAEVYVVRGVDERPKPSRELLAALERLSSVNRTMMKSLVTLGFDAMVRK